MESGSRTINLDHVAVAADVYRVSADFLLGRAPPEIEIDARSLAAARVLDGLKSISDTLMQHIDSSDRARGGPTAANYRHLLGCARAVVNAARRVDGDALEAIRGGGTLVFAVEQLEEEAVEAARRMAGFEGERQRLRDLLHATPSNDAT